MNEQTQHSARRIIIAGGGTGGHIFPAVAIANALKRMDPDIDILFVGAKGRMEMEKVPHAGYRIEGLTIAGYNRSSLIKNIGLPFKLAKSFLQVRSILQRFKPGAVLGVGGYSSFPVLKLAQTRGIPTFIHESNSFAGKSNILLGKKATAVFTGSDGMEKFFPAKKIIVTGNPVRHAISRSFISRSEGIDFFKLDPAKTTLLVIGGSLGARSINEAIDKDLDELIKIGLQVIWQTGRAHASRAMERAKDKKSVWVHEFITQMEYAYAAADIVVARAGAMTVAELCVAKKAVLFIPYPFAAEDHQTENAQKLVSRNAAIMIKDNEAKQKLLPLVMALAHDKDRRTELETNIGALAKANADEIIAGEILKVFK